MAEKDFQEGLGGLDEGPRASASEAQTPFGEAGDAADHPSVAALQEKFGAAIQHHLVAAGDEHVVYVDADRVAEILRWLKEDAGQRYLFLSDVTAVDFGGGRPLEVVYQLWSMELGRQLRVKATLPLSNLEIDSAVPIWRTADWLEREVFDLFGITFRGHPDLRRIMMPDNYAEGHPLRKDFPLRGRFSRAEQTRRALSMEVEDFYTPEELGIAGDKTRYGQEAGDATAAGAAGAAAGQGSEEAGA